jgi:hypothetical protein
MTATDHQDTTIEMAMVEATVVIENIGEIVAVTMVTGMGTEVAVEVVKIGVVNETGIVAVVAGTMITTLDTTKMTGAATIEFLAKMTPDSMAAEEAVGKMEVYRMGSAVGEEEDRNRMV